MRVSALFPAAASLLALASLTSATAVASESSSISVQHEKRTLGLLCGILSIFGGCQTSTSKYPSQSWQCNGGGNDGWKYDYAGNPCPSYLPSGWLWFGSLRGWHPPKGWNVPSQNWSPPSSDHWSCGHATWWAPSSSWHYPDAFQSLIPDFWWSNLGWHSYRGPTKSWYGGGKGTDGWNYDYKGDACPYGNNGFKFFGDKYGWGPHNVRSPLLSSPSLFPSTSTVSALPPSSPFSADLESPLHNLLLPFSLPSKAQPLSLVVYVPFAPFLPSLPSADGWRVVDGRIAPSASWQRPQGFSCPSWWPFLEVKKQRMTREMVHNKDSEIVKRVVARATADEVAEE